MALIPSPSALVELSRYAVGQVVETAAAVATVPFRVLGLLGQTELLVSRITVLAERAEGLIDRVDRVIDDVDATVGEAKLVLAAAALTVREATTITTAAAGLVERAGRTADGAATIVTDATTITDAASVVVRQIGATSTEAKELLDGYAPTLQKASPLAARFVDELSPEEVTAAIRMVDELPKLRDHLANDVMPLLGKLDQVGPDIHSLLEVTNDLHLAILGLPGLKMLRRRGEEKAADEDAANGR
jgi:hypothetical protein